MKCPECDGSGKVIAACMECWDEDDRPIFSACPKCGNTRAVFETCDGCNGSGKIES